MSTLFDDLPPPLTADPAAIFVYYQRLPARRKTPAVREAFEQRCPLVRVAELPRFEGYLRDGWCRTPLHPDDCIPQGLGARLGDVWSIRFNSDNDFSPPYIRKGIPWVYFPNAHAHRFMARLAIDRYPGGKRAVSKAVKIALRHLSPTTRWSVTASGRASCNHKNVNVSTDDMSEAAQQAIDRLDLHRHHSSNYGEILIPGELLGHVDRKMGDLAPGGVALTKGEWTR